MTADAKLNHLWLVMRIAIAATVIFAAIVSITAFVAEHRLEGGLFDEHKKLEQRLAEAEQRLVRIEARQIAIAEQTTRLIEFIIGVKKKTNDKVYNWGIDP